MHDNLNYQSHFSKSFYIIFIIQIAYKFFIKVLLNRDFFTFRNRNLYVETLSK